VTRQRSARCLGTGGLVKVRGSVDGVPFRSSSVALGDGGHKVTFSAELRRALGKEAGGSVTVRPGKRLA
jgi:hypothetical protein